MFPQFPLQTVGDVRAETLLVGEHSACCWVLLPGEGGWKVAPTGPGGFEPVLVWLSVTCTQHPGAWCLPLDGHLCSEGSGIRLRASGGTAWRQKPLEPHAL